VLLSELDETEPQNRLRRTNHTLDSSSTFVASSHALLLLLNPGYCDPGPGGQGGIWTAIYVGPGACAERGCAVLRSGVAACLVVAPGAAEDLPRTCHVAEQAARARVCTHVTVQRTRHLYSVTATQHEYTRPHREPRPLTPTPRSDCQPPSHRTRHGLTQQQPAHMTAARNLCKPHMSG
jgi:hypothetical protein